MYRLRNQATAATLLGLPEKIQNADDMIGFLHRFDWAWRGHHRGPEELPA